MKYLTTSPSTFSIVQACMQMYDYKKNQRILLPRPQNHMMMGKLGHYGLEVFYKSYGKPAVERIETVAMAIREESLAYTSLDGSEKQTIFDAVRDYIVHYIGENWVPVDVEKPFSKILYANDYVTVVLEGKIDLRYKQLESPDRVKIADHKFLWQKWPIHELQNQAIAYCFASDAKTFEHNGIYLYKKGADFARTPLSYDREQIEEWQHKTVPYYIDLLIKAHETGFYPMNWQACDRFGGCDYRDICKIPESIRSSIIATDYVKFEGEDLYD